MVVGIPLRTMQRVIAGSMCVIPGHREAVMFVLSSGVTAKGRLNYGFDGKFAIEVWTLQDTGDVFFSCRVEVVTSTGQKELLDGATKWRLLRFLRCS